MRTAIARTVLRKMERRSNSWTTMRTAKRMKMKASRKRERRTITRMRRRTSPHVASNRVRRPRGSRRLSWIPTRMAISPTGTSSGRRQVWNMFVSSRDSFFPHTPFIVLVCIPSGVMISCSVFALVSTVYWVYHNRTPIR